MRRPNARSAIACLSFVVLVSCAGGGPGEPGQSSTTTPSPAASSSVPETTSITGTPPSIAPEATTTTTTQPPFRIGAARLADSGFDPVAGARVALVVNQTSTVDGRHLIDLVHEAESVELVAILAPEHGVRGTADAGELVDDEIDGKTNTPVYSVYGSTRKPTPEMLAGVDTVIYDLQDVGARYYTFISTMGLAMQAAAEAGARFVVLDRPVPYGGATVTGHTRTADLESFIGQYPIPTQYGMTSGELARAIKGERWISGLDDLSLEVIDMQAWDGRQAWASSGLPWIPPSPGLPTVESAQIYPATVLFEATTVSYGRGTHDVFTVVGAPWADGVALARELEARNLAGVRFAPTNFVPRDLDIAPDPRLEGVALSGVQLIVEDIDSFDATAVGVHLLDAFTDAARAQGVATLIDRPETFDLLAGNTRLREAIASDTSPDEIIGSWMVDVTTFLEIRAKYLQYD